MLFTRSIGNNSRCSVLLINRCIDLAYVVTGITAPYFVYNDTLVECEMEMDNICVSDILIWQGVPLFEPTIAGVSARFKDPFLPYRQIVLMEWIQNLYGTGSGVVPIKVATWYATIEDAHLAYCLKENNATHLVARLNRKTLFQKDVMVSFSATTASTDRLSPVQPVLDNQEEETLCIPHIPNAVGSIVREFYVHATDLPDVFELYSDKSMIGVLESPEAVACVRSMRDSELLRDHQGSVIKFEFVSHLKKWTPFQI